MESTELLTDGPTQAARTIVLAHGAGAPMDSPFMEHIAAGLAERGVCVVRFEFDYMRRRRAGGARRPPDRAEALRRRWREVIERVGEPASLFIGGKSMGGRIASTIADEVGVRGLICLGYPFHPPGKPERLRVAHLADLRSPTLIVQGARDALGRREEVEAYDLSPSIRLHFLEDGDHSLKPRARSNRTEAQNLDEAVQVMVRFVVGGPGSVTP